MWRENLANTSVKTLFPCFLFFALFIEPPTARATSAEAGRRGWHVAIGEHDDAPLAITSNNLPLSAHLLHPWVARS